ncbi:MAG TPA: YihY/virulence factor BrkB family protein [Terracidiphilus sp.]|nr:YihY/virulence factor BrkB family protein [Terracidiphilus sp.]
MPKILSRFRRLALQALAHDVINTSKAAAYSGMLMLFPALLFITTLVAQIQTGSTFLGELRSIYEQFLPTDTLDLLQSYVLSRHLSSDRLIFSAASLSAFAGLGVMLSLMEGFRRAYRLPLEDWGFWSRRLRAVLLLPIALVPLSAATLVIVFGRQIEMWIFAKAGHDFRHIVIFFWRIARWSVTFLTSTTVLAALYHFGTRRKEHWLWVAPGAVVGTLLWFPATLAYGWYVARISDYSMFYGSFAAGIATLVWLYITAFSVLMGAEFNGVLYWERKEVKFDVDSPEPAPRRAEEVRSDSVEP